jgi:hypothetical protein
VADEYSSTHIKTGGALVPYGETYYVKVSSVGMQGWTIDIQVFK